MAKKDTKKPKKDLIENIEEDLTKFEIFFQKYQNHILWGVTIIVAIVALIWGYQKYIKQPREQAAQSEMFVAQKYFAIDSFQVALEGADQYPGFLDIIDQYKGTKAANLAYYYAGVCYANLGQWENAIDHLKKFKSEDLYLNSTKYGLMGDAYMQLNMKDKAVEAYKKSVEDYANHLTTPIYLKKLGLVYEDMGQYKKALKVYEELYKKYPASNEGRTIEKYIERVKYHLQEK